MSEGGFALFLCGLVLGRQRRNGLLCCIAIIVLGVIAMWWQNRFQSRPRQRRVALALQGGGAHGAFTWGVLDRLLEDGRFEIESVSGASAGAMNAVALAYGLATGDAATARATLTALWEAVAAHEPPDSQSGELLQAFGAWDEAEPTLSMKVFLKLTRLFSPYELNPLELNPLRDVIMEVIDFEKLRRTCPLQVYVAATEVRTGRLRLFEASELRPEMLLASACLPWLHHAVEVDGVAYWDGGYAGNPAVFPLLERGTAAEIIMVLLHPLARPSVPTNNDAIWTRAAEIGFSAAFLREMQALARLRAMPVQWLCSQQERRVRAARFHIIEAEDLMNTLSAQSKFNVRLAFLQHLRDQGRQAAESWLLQDQDGTLPADPVQRFL